MRSVFNEIIKPFFNLICRPLSSMPPDGLLNPQVYTAKIPLLLSNLVDKIQTYNGYKVLNCVVNFHNKVIGIVIENPDNISGFIPCYPSAIDDNLKNDIDYIFMTDLTIWNT